MMCGKKKLIDDRHNFSYGKRDTNLLNKSYPIKLLSPTMGYMSKKNKLRYNIKTLQIF